MPYRKYREIKQWGKINTRLYKRGSKRINATRMPKFQLSEAVVSAGIKVENPLSPEFFKQFSTQAERPELLHPAFRERSEADHPLYNEQRCRLFESFEPFSDGIDQACNIAKALKIEGLPSEVVNIQHNILRNTAEEVVKDCIMAGERYDPTLEKLERRHDPVLFWVNHPQVCGAPVLQKNKVILENLYRKVILAAIKEGKLDNLRCDREQYLSACLSNNGFEHSPLVIRGQPFLNVQSDKALSPWADAATVEASKDCEPPSVYPLSPFVDLTKSHLYNRTALVPRAIIPNLYIDTLLVTRQQSQKYPWTTEQNVANAIMQCFGAAVAQATRSMNIDQISAAGVLKKPVLTKTIQLVDGKLDFVAVQLNTLDLTAADGVKNFVWYEKAVPLYESKPYWENMEQVEGLNMEAFQRFIALLLKR